MKKCLLLLGVLVSACASLQTDLNALVVDAQNDLPGVETAANALWTAVNTTLTSAQFQALLTSYGVKASTIAAIQKDDAIAGSTIQVTTAVVTALDQAAAAAKTQ